MTSKCTTCKAATYIKIGLSTLSEISWRKFKRLKIVENQPIIVGSKKYKYLFKSLHSLFLLFNKGSGTLWYVPVYKKKILLMMITIIYVNKWTRSKHLFDKLKICMYKRKKLTSVDKRFMVNQHMVFFHRSCLCRHRAMSSYVGHISLLSR